MVLPKPHVLLQAHEDEQHDRFVEVLVWVAPFAMEHPSTVVSNLWEQVDALCEPRNGQLPVEYREIELLAPKINSQESP